MSANDSIGYFVELGEYSLILAKANLSQRPRAVEDLREVWLGDAPGVDAALKEIKGDGTAKAVLLLRLKPRTLLTGDAALAKRLNSPAAIENYLRETLGEDRTPANWSWVSQKDGRAPDGSTSWILDATPSTATDEAVNKATGWSFELLRCESASLALAGAVASAAKGASNLSAVLICETTETQSFLIAITAQGIAGFTTIPVGFDALAEATQTALGLKFRGSAARLMFNESYDFADSAAKISEPLVAGIRAGLPALTGITVTQIIVGGILARQTWLSQSVASGLGLKVFAPETAAWSTSAGIVLGAKVRSEIAPTWLGVLGAISAYDTRNPGATVAWHPVLSNTPVAAAAVVPAILQEAPPKPAVVITPPAPKAVEPVPAIKVEPPKPAAPAPKPAVVITPPPKPVEPPKPIAKTPPPPAKQVEPKPPVKIEPKAPTPPVKTPAKVEPPKAVPVAVKPTLSPAPTPVAPKAATAAPFPKQKKSSLPMIIVVALLVILVGGGGYFFLQNQKEKEVQLKHSQELEKRAASEAAARRTAEENAKKEADARKKAEEEAAQRAIVAEKARVESEERARVSAAEQLLSSRGSLIVNTDPAGATISVGELAPRPSPLNLKDLRLGRYSISIALPGYDPEQRDVDIKANDTVDLGTIKLRRQVGTVEITSDPAGLDYEIKPAGALFVNPADVRKGQTPATLNDVPAGGYQLTISKPNWPNYTASVNIDRNGTAKVHGTFVGGTIVISSNPVGAAVSRDQTQLGVTPLTLTDLNPGDVTFTISQRGYDPVNVNAHVEPGKTVNVSGTLLDTDRVMKLSELDERPVPQTQVEPELSSSARAEGGSATIEFVVGKDGIPADIKVQNSSSPSFGRACLTAAAKWRFRPGTVHGRAVRTRMILPFRMAPES